MSKDDKPLVPGNHLGSSPDVTEGGQAPKPGEGAGHPKGAASKAEAEGRGTDDTSTATQGKAEKEHAARMGAQKPQAGH